MRIRQILALSLMVFPGQAALFSQPKLGEWRTHLPYQFCTEVVATENRVYGSATGGLFAYNLEDNSVEKLSKIDGLSDNGVASMGWNGGNRTLVIVYQNSNIDIIRDGQVFNLPDLLKKQIPGDKSVHDIYFYEQDAYLSTGFGIVVLNLEKNEIRETYRIGDSGDNLKVNQVTSDGAYLYAATESGIRKGELDDPFLVDFNSWEVIGEVPNASGAFECIAFYHDALFASYRDPAGVQDIVYYAREGIWSPYPYFSGKRCQEMRVHDYFMTLVDDIKINMINPELLVVRHISAKNPKSAAIDPDGNVWVADYGRGLVTERDGEDVEIFPDGPQSTSAYAMASAGNRLYLVQGGVTGSWNNQFNLATLEVFSEESWQYTTSPESRDLIALAVDPGDPGHVFAASWGYGLHEYREGEEVAHYTESNSSLQSIIPGGSFIRIGGLAYDSRGNLWMTNSNVAEPISVLKADGSWKSFRADNEFTEFSTLGSIVVTRSGHKWGIIPRGNGLFAMDDNGTIDDESDDTYKRVSVVDKFGKVITNDVRSMAEDRNGNLWLGTSQGILVIYSPGRLFSEGSVYAQEIIVPRNDGTDRGDVLLGEQVVTAIEVDGANRKWLGTAGGGAYLVSEDGLEQVLQFDALSSPLLSDNIIDITVDGESGEVFFATDQGVISYRGDALAGSRLFDNVVVYPNPVREDYEGPVAIKGLLENTNVKIQDMSGNLVFETESLGGQAIWDGTNFRGERVATGVYLVFLTNAEGTQSHVVKLLFIH